MKKSWPWLMIALSAVWLWGNPKVRSTPEPRPERHRSPIDLVLLPGGQRALTANHTSDSASLIDLAAGKVLAELSCGHKPAGVACSPDGRRAAVSNLWAGTLTLVEVQGDTLHPAGTVTVGSQPRGLVFAPDGKSLHVALAGDDAVVQVDAATGKVLQRWPAPAEPRRLALSRDGRSLVAVSSRSAQVYCWDTQSGKRLWERKLLDGFNLHGLAFSPDDKELLIPHIHDRTRSISKRNIEEGWAIDNRLSRITLQPDEQAPYWQIALDLRGEALGDPCAVAFDGRGEFLAVAAAGTHELAVLKRSAIPWSPGEPGDLLDSTLAVDENKFRRVPLGGRPVAVQFRENSTQAVVANYLLDSVQLVDVQTGKLLRTIALGGPAHPSLARQGEAIFYDARRSHHQWFSCHTCHPDGHTSSRTFDTLNDDSDGNPKLTPTLRGVIRTGPWTWHGGQQDLGRMVEKSMTKTLWGPKPSAADVQAMLAFLGTLDHPPNTNHRPEGSLSPAAQQGQAVFQGKARCSRCHQGEDYTSNKNYDVKIESDGSPFDLWNPPSLRGLRDRGPYLHDGRAETLEEVLRSSHSSQKLGGAGLTVQELQDLVEFLKSL